jgi:hypothetical protein
MPDLSRLTTVGPCRLLFDFSMVRVVFDPSRGVGRERCNTLLTAVSDEFPVPVAGDVVGRAMDRPSGGGWTRRLSIETSGGAIFSRLYAASSDSGGRVNHAPSVWCPAGWVAGWESQFCIDGTILFAVCVRRTVRDNATQTEAEEEEKEEEEDDDGVTRVVPESPLANENDEDDDDMSYAAAEAQAEADSKDREGGGAATRPLLSSSTSSSSSSSSSVGGRGAIDPPFQSSSNKDDSLVFKRPLTPAPPAITPSLDDDPEVDRLSQITPPPPPPQVIPGNVMLSPPVPKIAVGPAVKRETSRPRDVVDDDVLPIQQQGGRTTNRTPPHLRAPPGKRSTPRSSKPKLRVLRQMLLTSMTGARRTLLSTPSKAVLLQRRSGSASASASASASDFQNDSQMASPAPGHFARLFDRGLRSVRRPSVLIRQTHPCGQRTYYVCLPMVGDRAATDDKIGGLELLELPFGSAMVASKMPYLARILLANTRATATGCRTPCVPRLARFKISLPAYKFMKNHVEKTTPANWVSHSNPDYSDLAILTDKRLADSTYDLMVERILAGY